MLVRWNQADLKVIEELKVEIDNQDVKKLSQLVVNNFTNHGNPKRESYRKIFTAVCYLKYGGEAFILSVRKTTPTRIRVRLIPPKEAQVPLVFAPDERELFGSSGNISSPVENDQDVREYCQGILKGIRISGNEYNGWMDLMVKIISESQIHWVGKNK